MNPEVFESSDINTNMKKKRKTQGYNDCDCYNHYPVLMPTIIVFKTIISGISAE